MRNIRIEVVKFHLEVNKKIMNFLKVAILIAALLQIPLGFIFGFKIGYYVLIIVAVLVNVLFSKSVQLHLAIKNIDKTFRKLSIDQFQVNFEADEICFTIISNLGTQTIQSHFKYSEIHTSQYHSKEAIIIFTSGRFASNYSKSRPRYIYLGYLDEDDKQNLISNFKSNSNKFLIDDKIEKSFTKEVSNKKSHKIRNIILFLAVVAVIISASQVGVFNLFTYGTYPYNSEKLVEKYDQYVTNETETTLMVFGYIKNTNDLVLNSYFIDPTRDVVYAEYETKYCNTHYESISEDVNKCYGRMFQYGINSHRIINLIIRLEKEKTIDIQSNDIDFIFIDSFDDYNYYIASFYGSVKDKIEFRINGKVYD